ncbi:MAG: hypothetical protein ACRDLN_04935 [Solirubrobacteraceae bacterium]
MIAASGGNASLSRRWWRRAQHAADASGDSRLSAHVAGQRAVHALYADGSPEQALALAKHCLAITSAPCAGRMHALAAAAKSSAVLDRRKHAEGTLAMLEREFERLPRDVTNEKVAAGGWAEERLHHARSYAAAFVPVAGGDAARAAALRLYPAGAWRGPAQIKLHVALAERAEVAPILAPLSDAQRSDRSVRSVIALADANRG